LNFSQTLYGTVRNEGPLTATTVPSKTRLRVKCVRVEQGAIFQKKVLLTQWPSHPLNFGHTQCVVNRENAANSGWQSDNGLRKDFFGE